jgi:hypothetical protein
VKKLLLHQRRSGGGLLDTALDVVDMLPKRTKAKMLKGLGRGSRRIAGKLFGKGAMRFMKAPGKFLSKSASKILGKGAGKFLSKGAGKAAGKLLAKGAAKVRITCWCWCFKSNSWLRFSSDRWYGCI